MTNIRPQYHFRQSPQGLLAWNVQRLIKLTNKFKARNISLLNIAELDINHWYTHNIPTCRSIAEHSNLICEADITFPIILDQKGRVMDGMHRVCKALSMGMSEISCVQFESDPAPDYVGKDPYELPYDS